MNLHIAVCDDESRIGFQIERYIEKSCANMKIAVEIDVFYSGEELCNKLSRGKYYDLIFLDSEIPDINGQQVGLKIHEEYHSEVAQIVYISGMQEFALDLFEVSPLNFLMKPLNYGSVEKVINKFLKISGFWFNIFTYKIGQDTFKVKLKDIIYFERNGRKVKIHFKDRTEEIYNSLEEIYIQQLKKYDFLFIHKLYIVNYEHISLFEYENLYLSNRIKLPIAQSKRKGIRTLQKTLDKRRM